MVKPVQSHIYVLVHEPRYFGLRWARLAPNRCPLGGHWGSLASTLGLLASTLGEYDASWWLCASVWEGLGPQFERFLDTLGDVLVVLEGSEGRLEFKWICGSSWTTPGSEHTGGGG